MTTAITTRWHADDLAGRLLAEMENGGDQWRIVRLPALAEADDPMGRAPGEALWPDWFPVAALERIRATIGERDWAALYQQHPAPPEGALFKVAMIGVHEAVPACEAVARSWDFAATDGGDWTVGLKLGRSVALEAAPAGPNVCNQATASRPGMAAVGAWPTISGRKQPVCSGLFSPGM